MNSFDLKDVDSILDENFDENDNDLDDDDNE